jgi:hypothetical protein
MRNPVISGTCMAVALGFAVSVGAQEPQPQPPQPQPQQQQQRQMDKDKATVVGCLQRGEEPGTFVLANARFEAGAPAGVGTTGRPTDRPADRPATPDRPGDPQRERTDRDDDAMAFELTGQQQELQQHIGHQIRVQGTFVPQPDKDRDYDRPTTAQPGQPGQPGQQPGQQRPGAQQDRDKVSDKDIKGRLQVEEVQMVSQTCPPAGQHDR